MDIRINAYRPVTVTSFGATGSLPAAVSVSRADAPVDPVRATNAVNNSGASDFIQMTQPTDSMRSMAQSEGRGRIVDIFA